MRSTVVVLSLISIYGVIAAKNGIIGFGISLYQDLCCQACHDSLSTLYLSCTTFPHDMPMDMDSDASMDMDMSMAMMGTTSDDCYASNIPWLQTMAYCIQQNCDADGYSAENQAKCFSAQAVAGASKPTFYDSLPATAPKIELSKDAQWLNVTSLVNSDTYQATHGTYGEFTRSEYIHTRYSLILYFILIGICIGGGILAQARSALPGFQKQLQSSSLWVKLQQHIFLPALFGSRRLEPLPRQVGYIPGRALSIFIGIYIIINIILSAVSFRNFWPNIWWASVQFEMCEYVGNRTGTLSLVNLTIAILFAGRNNLLIALTGWSQTTFLTLHRWTSRMSVLQAVVHSVAYTLAYFEPGGGGAAGFAAKASEPFYWWGIIATIAFCLVLAFAVFPLRIKYYEFFLITHIVLVILTLIGCWYHLVPHFGFDYGYQVWLYIAFAFWSTDRLARLGRIVYYNRFTGATAVVEALPNCDIMQVSIFLPVSWKFGPGQHTFLYLPSLGKFWENHPFSIAGWKSEEQPSPVPSISTSQSADGAIKGGKAEVSTFEVHMTDLNSQTSTEKNQHATLPRKLQAQRRVCIKFMIRAHSGTTRALQRHLFSSPSGPKMELSVYTEGPYAGHRATLQPLFNADTIVCIVGGIGITNVLGFIQEYTTSVRKRGESRGKSRGIMNKANRFVLAWSVKEIALLQHVKQNFLPQEDEVEGLEYLFWCTGSEIAAQKLDSNNDERHTPQATLKVTSGRMDIGAVIRSSLEPGLQTTVLACGPGYMSDEATRQVVNCVKDGLKVDLVEEIYAW